MSNCAALSPESFVNFFQDVYGHKPFQWQVDLAEKVCDGNWPEFIQLPTASGKTSCIDIAVFALAYQASRRETTQEPIAAARRIFFVVDRRIIVSEAYQRAQKLKEHLDAALRDDNQMGSTAHQVAHWLRKLSGNENAPPLDCYELRGGIYRDDAWVRSILQPTVITSTVDQIGSRILFRGYGVSDRNLPIHAALTANDSLIILDEAHCSKPFRETMNAVKQYRDTTLIEEGTGRWAEQPLQTPFHFVEMSATLRLDEDDQKEADIFQLKESYYQTDPELKKRHQCSKPVQLIESNAKGGKQNQILAKQLVEQAEKLAAGDDDHAGCQRIAIIVNRVACAREAFEILRKKYGNRAELMIGRMRPIDRDELTKTLQRRFEAGSEETLNVPHFLVATQCLEVGADFDFDGMVTQCASLDALRQRFGRLNRLGQSEHARGVIVMANGDIAPRNDDPIYGKSLPKTWAWLQQHVGPEGMIDFGVCPLGKVIDKSDVTKLSPEVESAPVLMPAHLDILCQTSPRPAIEPDIAAYLHGPNRGQPEVRVCWRADLPEISLKEDDSEDTVWAKQNSWAESCLEALDVCPPSVGECLSVPLFQFKKWLQGRENEGVDDSGDFLGEQLTDDDASKTAAAETIIAHRIGVVWDGKKCKEVSASRLRNVKPNSLIVLPASAGGWSVLGYVPDAPSQHVGTSESDDKENKSDEKAANQSKYELARIDLGTEAFEKSRNRKILRVHENLMTCQADYNALAIEAPDAPVSTIPNAPEGLWKFVKDVNLPLTHKNLKYPENAEQRKELLQGDDSDTSISSEAPSAAKLTQAWKTLTKVKGGIRPKRYPGGFVMVGPHQETRQILSRASFDDEFDEHNFDAIQRVELSHHLADVAAETKHVANRLGLSAELTNALTVAAERHDLGKADLRFQAMLLGSTVELAAMQSKLWAKSDQGVGRPKDGTLPRGFRHEMLSLDLACGLEHDLDPDWEEVMQHAVSAHHGHGRPFAPVVDNSAPLDVDLSRLDSSVGSGIDVSISAAERLELPAHRLDSGIPERFWKLNQRFGWWGLAWVESILRLADWTASAQPIDRNQMSTLVKAAKKPKDSRHDQYELPLIGLNATNPLGFLAALGALRAATSALRQHSVCMRWNMTSVWHPVLLTDVEISQEEFVSLLQQELHGKEKEDHFTKLGKNINVGKAEFRFAVNEALQTSNCHNRTTVDYYAAYGSDALGTSHNTDMIQDTALRTMAGTGHQHFLETMSNLITQCQPAHLEKTLFRNWDYSDPTQALSLRFDPLDDNRYALRWRNPSGDPSRRSSGSMLGANRLAVEAIPMLVTAAGEKRLHTTGFTGHRSNDTFFHWPIWSVPLSLSVVQSLLMSPDVISVDPVATHRLQQRGVSAVVRSQRITIGKFRNFTPASVQWSAVGRRVQTEPELALAD